MMRSLLHSTAGIRYSNAQYSVPYCWRTVTIYSARDLMDDNGPCNALEAFKALHHPERKAAEKLLLTDGWADKGRAAENAPIWAPGQ